MLSILTQYLEDNASPELKDTLVDAITGLENAGLTLAGPDYEELLMTDEQYAQGSTLHEIIEMTSRFQANILTQHTITLSDQTPMDTVTRVITAILFLPDYQNKAELLDILNADESAAETMAALLALVTGDPAEVYLPYLENVGLRLFARIRELAEQEMANQNTVESEITDKEKYIHNLKFFLGTIQNQPLLLTEMLRSGMSVGYPYLDYADRIGRQFEGFLPDRIAQEMIAMAIVSSDGTRNIRATVLANLERYISSVTVTTRVVIQVDHFLKSYVHE